LKILAVDTSCSVAAVAVISENKLMAHYYIDDKLTHSQKLMPVISQVLTDLELTPKDIDVFGATVGPGSFTGLRIGIATIKGMATAAGKPVCGISSTMAMAYNFPYCDYNICPMIDARNTQVFNGVYRFENGNMKEITPPRVIEIEKLKSEIKTPTLVLGDGACKYYDLLKDIKNIYFAPKHLNMPNGAAAAYGILQKVQGGQIMQPGELLPLYLRKSQAEQEKERRNKQ